MIVVSFALLVSVIKIIFLIFALGASSLLNIWSAILFVVLAILIISFFEYYFISTFVAVICEYKIIRNLSISNLEKCLNLSFTIITAIFIILFITVYITKLT